MKKLLIVAAVLALLFVAWSVLTRGASASERMGDGGAPYTLDVSPQEQEDGEAPEATASGNDSLLELQLWTLVAAAGAGGIFLVLFVLRAGMGWISVPTPEELEAASHH